MADSSGFTLPKAPTGTTDTFYTNNMPGGANLPYASLNAQLLDALRISHTLGGRPEYQNTRYQFWKTSPQGGGYALPGQSGYGQTGGFQPAQSLPQQSQPVQVPTLQSAPPSQQVAQPAQQLPAMQQGQTPIQYALSQGVPAGLLGAFGQSMGSSSPQTAVATFMRNHGLLSRV